MEKRFIYADNAATTAVSQSVLDEMLPYFTVNFGNPSSAYRHGREARRAVTGAGERIAAVMGCLPSEIYFTSGGSESDSWAVCGAAAVGAAHGKRHIITTAIEHHAVLNSCRGLEKQGFEVTYLPVGKSGIISPQQVKNALREDTALVSVMAANNETGTIQPVGEIGEICRERRVPFHTDAVQAVGNIPLNMSVLGADMLSMSGHKIHAPKGIGFLFIRKGTEILPLVHGGGQEKGMRGGTENVPAIVGLARAVEDICADIEGRAAKITAVRNFIIDGLLDGISGAALNGDREKRLSGNINISFSGIESESLLLMLDMKGICASGGSACASGSAAPSHVLTAIGASEEMAKGALRLTIDEDITLSDGEYIIHAVRESVERLRKMTGQAHY